MCVFEVLRNFRARAHIFEDPQLSSKQCIAKNLPLSNAARLTRSHSLFLFLFLLCRQCLLSTRSRSSHTTHTSHHSLHRCHIRHATTSRHSSRTSSILHFCHHILEEIITNSATGKCSTIVRQQIIQLPALRNSWRRVWFAWIWRWNAWDADCGGSCWRRGVGL